MTGRPLRVLLVEDSNSDAELVRLELQRAGFELCIESVAAAADFQAALERSRWDVVLSDYALPRFSGKMALELLRGRGADIPFIIVSGSLGEDVAVEMMRAGAQDFFPKGNLTRLPAAIEREVREAEKRRMGAARQKEADEERERLLVELCDAVRARDTFLALAAHELRTPLTVAQLKLDRLRQAHRRQAEARPEEGLEQSLASIARQHWRLAALVDNFVAVARITSGDRILNRELVDLGEEVAAALRQFDDEVRASGSTISVRTDSRVIGRWDRSYLRIVVANLMGNAIKYGAGKPIEIVLASDAARAQFTVLDRGKGVSREDQARIFNKFEYAVPARHHGGFGLGLWVVRGIVEVHGGAVSVANREGGGSSFTIELPLGNA